MSDGERNGDCDVAIIGGGPAGCSAGVFTARYGLDTLLFDRGRSSIQRCAYLETYPDFPGGIDLETFSGLLHDHAEAAGCELVADRVESVEATDGGSDGGDDDSNSNSDSLHYDSNPERSEPPERSERADRVST